MHVLLQTVFIRILRVFSAVCALYFVCQYEAKCRLANINENNLRNWVSHHRSRRSRRQPRVAQTSAIPWKICSVLPVTNAFNEINKRMKSGPKHRCQDHVGKTPTLVLAGGALRSERERNFKLESIKTDKSKFKKE